MAQNPWKKFVFPLLIGALFFPRCTGGEKPPSSPHAGESPSSPDQGEASEIVLSEEELVRIAEETAQITPLASHLKNRYTDDLDGLRERRYIRVLTTFNKTNFFLEGSRPFGYEYSMLHGYEVYLNRDRGREDLKIVLDFIPVSRDRLIPLLVNGYGDIAAAGLTITPKREKLVDFTIPYLTNVDEVIVANHEVRGLHSMEDLSGREVFVRPSSSYWGTLEKLNRRFSEEGLPPVKLQKADESLETEDILEMVNAGVVPLTVADSQMALLWESVFQDLTVYKNLAIRKGGKIAWAVRKNNPELKASLDAFLKTHRKGTLLGNIYLRRYFEHNKWIRNPFNKKAVERQEQYRSLIKKYADMYEFDWMLILALAYQESRLNHHTVSPFGARGIMQVRPSTALDHNVDIQDTHQLENNIHAGVKYLAFLRDRYFSDEDVEEKDRMRFALAAYNAGPRKILRARNQAEELGLDRNKWFRNVEIAALQQIGQETVQYVSNINKYYLLFTFNEEHEKRKRSIKGVPPPTAPGENIREDMQEEMAMR